MQTFSLFVSLIGKPIAKKRKEIRRKNEEKDPLLIAKSYNGPWCNRSKCSHG